MAELKELADSANGNMQNENPVTKEQELAETARQKAMKRVRGRNAQRSFADDDDEALFGAINEDAAADEEELGRYRQDSEDLNNFLRDNPRGASLLSSMRRDGNPVGKLVEDYGEDIVKSLDDPEIRKSVVEAEAKRLEQIAKDREFEQTAQENLEKSKQARQELIDEGRDPEEVDAAIKEIIDRAMRNLMSDITKDDIVGVLNNNNRESDLAEASRQGEVRGRNANISRELQQRRKGSDGMPNITSTATPTPKQEEKKNGALDAVADRRPVW